MQRRKLFAGIAVFAAIGQWSCAEPTSVEFEQSPVAAGFARQVAAPGSYELFFMIETTTGLASVESSAPVRSFLVLRSEVRDGLGALATAGKVTYEYCWSKGDYAPKASCANGTGTWKRLFTMSVDPVGSRFGFGSCSTPRSIGFRFKYSGSSTIGSGISAPRDFTWLATT